MEARHFTTEEIEEVRCVNGPTMLHSIVPTNLDISSLLAKVKKAHEDKEMDEALLLAP